MKHNAGKRGEPQILTKQSSANESSMSKKQCQKVPKDILLRLQATALICKLLGSSGFSMASCGFTSTIVANCTKTGKLAEGKLFMMRRRRICKTDPYKQAKKT